MLQSQCAIHCIEQYACGRRGLYRTVCMHAGGRAYIEQYRWEAGLISRSMHAGGGAYIEQCRWEAGLISNSMHAGRGAYIEQ